MAIDLLNLGTVANDRTGDTWRAGGTKINSMMTELYGEILDTLVVVKQASDLAGTLDSTKQYFIDGIVDMGSQSISVPAGGLNLTGYNFNVSQLVSTASSYTMFVSPVGGSGDILGKDYAISVSGTSSQVYDLTDATGFNAFEFARINYNDCTSLGTINGYRQGLESGTGRFGGKPELTLAGTWLGGYFIESSIVRSLDDGAYTLFKAGGSFVMTSRFRSNQNIDLPASASFFDFATANFTNPSTIQLDGCIVTRAGVSDASDSNLTPNIAKSDLKSRWRNNTGLPNTFEGGELTITTETATVITTSLTSDPTAFVDLAGTYTATDLQHFDEPADGQLRHLGDSPREYTVTGQLVVVCTANDEVDIKIRIYRAATSSFVDGKTIRRVINNLVGSRDVAYFVLDDHITLAENDYVKLQAGNVNATNNITAELSSYFTVEAR
jgi:hypothetical protein